MKIFLIRHGVKEKTPGDPALSSLGRLQAQNTAEHLRQFQVDEIYASPLKRTQETAKYISDAQGKKFTIKEDLRERMNWGDAPGQSFEDFISEWKQADEDREFQPKSGDSSRNAGKRLESVIESIYKKKPVSTVVLVCHGGIITDFLRNTFTNVELDNAYDNFTMVKDGAIKECSITLVHYENEKYTLESLALIDHIQAEE
jgi:broad specificity phosphatase PhoE